MFGFKLVFDGIEKTGVVEACGCGNYKFLFCARSDVVGCSCDGNYAGPSPLSTCFETSTKSYREKNQFFYAYFKSERYRGDDE